MKRVAAWLAGAAASGVLGAAMLPVRAHIAIATAGLVLVIPVVLGVTVGGFPGGVASVGAGFLVFDLLYIPPYLTLTVSRPQYWVALGVYVVVMLLVARVVAVLAEARAAAEARIASARYLFDLSELLLANKAARELGQTIVDELVDTFGLRGVALVVAGDGRMEEVATSGEPVTPEELRQLGSGARVPVALGVDRPGADPKEDQLRVVALSTIEHPVGLLVVRGLPSAPSLWELLPTLANQLALAFERAEFHERALRAEVLEEVDRLRQALVGAVSHDLRTPLATIKIASSTLLDPENTLPDADVRELHSLIDVQSDRLNRLVTNLLDMTRLEAGVLDVHRSPTAVLDLVGEALAGIRPSLAGRSVVVNLPDELPTVDADHLLVGQVLTNLIDNAHRHAPAGTPITVGAQCRDGEVAVSVADEGPGVPPDERESVFERFVRFDTGGRAGLGLALSKTFVEAHGGRIWVEADASGGARFVFTLRVASSPAMV